MYWQTQRNITLTCTTDYHEGVLNAAVSRRRKRTTSGKRYIETAVVVDPEMYAFHGNETEKLVRNIMDVVGWVEILVFFLIFT